MTGPQTDSIETETVTGWLAESLRRLTEIDHP